MLRIGNGYDLHRIKKGNHLVLGNVKVPCQYSFIAHSDGDVLLHSLIDALLGAVALGDIGYHFPPSDAKYKDIDSKELLIKTLDIIGKVEINNVDITLVLEEPKLKPFIQEIRESIAKLLSIKISQVSVKAKTNETCDAIGKKEAVACYCSLLLNTID